MNTISIDLGTRGYDIHIGAGLSLCLSDCLSFDISARDYFIVTDENVVPIARDIEAELAKSHARSCLLYTSPSPRDRTRSRMPSSA